VTSISHRAFAAPGVSTAAVSTDRLQPARAVLDTNWRDGLAELRGDQVRLRELAAGDAVTLQALLTTKAVTRAINAPPDTVDAFERFITAMRSAREGGEGVCFGIVPANTSSAVGLIQIRALEPTFKTAEWGFALGAPYWGTGLFVEAAFLALDFAFDVLGVHRLEARAAVVNGRGNGVLRKLGATQELVLRRAFRLDGRAMDQALWSLLDSDWRERRLVVGAHTPVH
jgi:RimJ/RimL family protein N-acetyltransferase